jgi:hypothetical protein
MCWSLDRQSPHRKAQHNRSLKWRNDPCEEDAGVGANHENVGALAYEKDRLCRGVVARPISSSSGRWARYERNSVGETDLVGAESVE